MSQTSATTCRWPDHCRYLRGHWTHGTPCSGPLRRDHRSSALCHLGPSQSSRGESRTHRDRGARGAREGTRRGLRPPPRAVARVALPGPGVRACSSDELNTCLRDGREAPARAGRGTHSGNVVSRLGRRRPRTSTSDRAASHRPRRTWDPDQQVREPHDDLWPATQEVAGHSVREGRDQMTPWATIASATLM